MKRYLLTKIGCSHRMADMIAEGLTPIVSPAGPTEAVLGGTTLLMHFQSPEPLEAVVVRLKSLRINNFFVSVIEPGSFGGKMETRMGERLGLAGSAIPRKEKAPPERDLDQELEDALAREDYEEAAKVRNLIKQNQNG